MRVDRISPHDTRRLVREMQLHPHRARDIEEQLLNAYLGLVLFFVSKRQRAYDDQQDAVQVGTVALLRAIRSYDWRHRVSFSSYAARAIVNALTDVERRGNPRDREVSLDLVAGGSLPDIIPDPQAVDPERAALRSALPRRLKAALTKLSPRDSMALILRYGLDGGRPLSLSEIAGPLRLKDGRAVSNLEARSMAKMRAFLRVSVSSATAAVAA